MPAIAWTDKPRKDFLTSKLPGFQVAQEQRQTKQFMQALHKEYFDKFPEPDELKKGSERKRVYNWFNNHNGSRVKKDLSLLSTTRQTFMAMLFGTVPTRRKQKLQATQAYSELYWETKLRTIILDEWKTKRINEPDLPKSQYISYMNMRIKQFYDAESSDIHAEVEHYRQNKWKKEVELGNRFLLPGEEDLDIDEQDHRIQARKIQAAIDNIQPALTEVAKVVEEFTGLKCHFMVAGPEPRRKGRIVNITVTAGRSRNNKRKFPDHSTLYKPNVSNFWNAFVRTCFTPEERTRYKDVPFPGYEDEEEIEGSASKTEAVSQKEPTRIPRRGRKTNASPQVLSPSSPSNDDDDDEVERLQRDPGVADKMDVDNDGDDSHDDASDGDSNVDEEDFAELMSQSLPPERRVVEKKISEGSYTTYRTQKGSWLTYYELKRLANIARNAGIIDALGIPDAASRLTTRGGDAVQRQVPARASPDDNVEYSEAGSRPRPSVPARAQPPRASKNQTLECTNEVDMAELPIPKEADSPLTVPPLPSDTSTTSASLLSSIVLSTTPLSLPAPSHDAPASLTSFGNEDGLSMDVDNNERAVATSVATNESRHSPPVENEARASAMTELNAQSTSGADPTSRAALDLETFDFEKLPSWLIGPAQYLAKNFRGEVEDELLANLLLLELAWNPLDKKMGTDNRPTAVPWWIKNARRMSKIPTNIDLVSFPDQVRQWWKTTLPGWRVPDGSEWPLSREVPTGEDWCNARRGGPNGLFLVVMCLYWWRCVSQEEEDRVAYAEYLSVVEDVSFVFGEMLHSHSVPVFASTPSADLRPSSTTANSGHPMSIRASGKKGKPAISAEVSRTRPLRSSEKSTRRSTRARA